MNDQKPTRIRRVINHVKSNADIYVPLAVFATGVTILALVGRQIVKESKEYNAWVQEMLDGAPEGSRLVADVVTGQTFIAEPHIS